MSEGSCSGKTKKTKYKYQLQEEVTNSYYYNYLLSLGVLSHINASFPTR
jgi:hypothetical protein